MHDLRFFIRRELRAAFAVRCCALLLISVAALCVGCGPAMRWYYDRNTAEIDSKRDTAPRFVYFRSPFSIACTNFEDTALKDPQVIRATSDMLCIMLSYEFDKQVAATWGVNAAPGIAIIGPDNVLLAARSGDALTTDDVLQCIAAARAALEKGADAAPRRGAGATSKPLVTP